MRRAFSHREVIAQTYRYVRWVSKFIGLTFAPIAVLVFVIQAAVLTNGGWWIVVGAGLLWATDTVLSTHHDLIDIMKDIRKHERRDFEHLSKIEQLDFFG